MKDNYTTVPGFWRSARALAACDLQLAWQRRSDALQPALFSLLIVTLFTLASGRDAGQLTSNAVPVLWLAALLSSQLSLQSMFRSDSEDGSLEQWLLAPVPLAWLALIRMLVSALVTLVPLLCISPLLGYMLHLPADMLPILILSLVLGVPLLSLVGGIIAALTLAAKSSAILPALLALPLYVPVLVFGAGSVIAAAKGQDPVGGLLMLAAGLVVALVMAPLATSAAIRISLG